MTEFPKPNYKVWDDVDIFDQLQVVCLWAEFEPSLEALKEERCQALQRRLKEARQEGLLLINDPIKVFSNGKLEYQQLYQRYELIAYAERDGLRPAFLFPETRALLDAPVPQDNSPTPNPAASPSNAKVEVVLDTEVEPHQKEVGEKINGESHENEQSKISKHEYTPEIYGYFDLLTKKGIIKLFPIDSFNWESTMSHAGRNGLSKAQVIKGKYNPAMVASWLIEKGHITQVHANGKLKNALPTRSKHFADVFTNMESD